MTETDPAEIAAMATAGLVIREVEVETLGRAYKQLLTEHAAREHPLGCEACMVEIRKAVARGVTYLDNSMLCSAALHSQASDEGASKS